MTEEPLDSSQDSPERKTETTAGREGEGAANPPQAPPPQAPPRTRSPPWTLADVAVGAFDSRNQKIKVVYAKKSNYAIYQTADLMIVQYSDDPAMASQQAPRVDAVGDLRAKIEYLAGALRSKARAFYFRQLANGLQAALDEQADDAKRILVQAIENATQDLVRAGRKSYLMSATALAAVLATALILVGGLLRGGAAHTGLLLLSAGSGAIGAMLSIAIAFRSRTVAPDQDFGTNLIDGGLRVGIGVISGFFVPLMLTSGILGPLSAGGLPAYLTHVGTGLNWQIMLAIGFIAGFLERLVPDLLDKVQAQGSPAPATAPAPPPAPAPAAPPNRTTRPGARRT